MDRNATLVWTFCDDGISKVKSIQHFFFITNWNKNNENMVSYSIVCIILWWWDTSSSKVTQKILKYVIFCFSDGDQSCNIYRVTNNLCTIHKKLCFHLYFQSDRKCVMVILSDGYIPCLRSHHQLQKLDREEEIIVW